MKLEFHPDQRAWVGPPPLPPPPFYASGSRSSRSCALSPPPASQFKFLEALTQTPGIDWARVEMFHLDEYVGLPITHPASFRKYLLERLIQPTGLQRYHLLDGEADAAAVCRQVGDELNRAPIDVAFVGIGERTSRVQ